MKEYIPQIIATVAILLITPGCRFIARKIISRYGAKTLKTESRILQTKRVVSVMINLICVFSITAIWGVQPQNMLVAISSVFAVIGVAMFAQWSVLSNITAGIIIFFTTPFHLGDEIVIVDKDFPIEATIENIMTFYTHLRTKEGDLIVLPNSLFLQKIVSKPKSKNEQDVQHHDFVN